MLPGSTAVSDPTVFERPKHCKFVSGLRSKVSQQAIDSFPYKATTTIHCDVKLLCLQNVLY